MADVTRLLSPPTPFLYPFIGLLPFAPLMQRPAGVEAEAWLRQCVNRAQQMPMDETVKDHYLVHLAILSGLTYNIETIATMYESSVVQ